MYMMKYSFQVISWPFASVTNKLGVVIQSKGQTTEYKTSSDVNKCNTATTSDSTGNLLYYTCMLAALALFFLLILCCDYCVYEYFTCESCLLNIYVFFYYVNI